MPEGAGADERVEGCDHVGKILPHVGEVVGVSPLREVRTGKEPHHFTRGDDSSLFLFTEPFPPVQMFFRPEEVHRASRVGNVEGPPVQGHRDMAYEAFRLLGLDPAVLHLHPYGLSAVEAHRIDADRLSRKQPADRQRLERSLAEPFLPSVDGEPVVRGQTVERRERNDGVGFRVEPARKAERRKELAHRLSALLRRHPQGGCDLRVVRRLPGRYEMLDDKVKRLVQVSWISHDFTSC